MSAPLFNSLTVVDLKVKLDRPIDRDHPCCRNICIIGPAEEPYGGSLHCADCGRSRGWISKISAQWIEHVARRFGAPRDTPIIVRRAHTYEPPSVASAQRSAINHARHRRELCFGMTKKRKRNSRSIAAPSTFAALSIRSWLG